NFTGKLATISFRSVSRNLSPVSIDPRNGSRSQICSARKRSIRQRTDSPRRTRKRASARSAATRLWRRVSKLVAFAIEENRSRESCSMEMQRPERSHKHQPDLYHETSVPNQLALPRTNDDIANRKRSAVRRRFPPWPAPFETAPAFPVPCSSPYFCVRRRPK